MNRVFTLGIRVFGIGLLIHFFLYTRVTFSRGIDIGAIRAWKEGVIALLTICAAGWLFGARGYKNTSPIFRRIALVFLLGVFGTLAVHFLYIDAPLSRRAMSMRYDYLGFFLLLLGRVISLCIGSERSEVLLKRYGRVVKRCLILALIRRCVVAIKPGTLKLFGYNNYVFEGVVGQQPPAVYYTHINYGLPRSQFLFERPTTYGFFLTAFFPLFYMLFLRRRRWQDTRGRWVIYGMNIVLTFSRAARGSRIIIALLLIGLTSAVPLKKLLVKYGLPLLVLFGLILGLGRQQIALRGYSNTGHIAMIQKGVQMFIEKPIRGRGGASAGPGSHREGGAAFNPENQFLQILVEFGALGSLPWLFLWFRSMRYGIRTIKYGHTGTPEASSNTLYLFAFALGMLTLTISGMVLHSFGDRMVTYPFMLFFGLAIGYHEKMQKGEIEE